MEKKLWQPYLSLCLQNLRPPAIVSAFESVAHPKLTLRPVTKSMMSEPIDSTKMFQKFEAKVLTLSLRPD